ncbi:dnaJ homolog subfamily C GRV2-like [Sesamum indicum]|uniref:DnaJ homolog subfamily C GRV2-like n=1 Tax=Sesamum indicum TaxID=4182 RepID=A0A8M8UT73_SESIN|nr:dnaJ homolog subfamily C GRV2-like [Sesamum indicum]
MWREELTRRPMDLYEEEACKILEISIDEVSRDDAPKKPSFESVEEIPNILKQIEYIDEEKLKRQYRKLAMKYHPNKNPEGREKFLAVQKAYECLQVTMQGLQGPQTWRLLLLLLMPFKYAGYPMLLSAITWTRMITIFFPLISTSSSCILGACLVDVRVFTIQW